VLGVGNSHNKKQQNRQCTRRPNCHARKLAFYGNSATAYTAAVLGVRLSIDSLRKRYSVARSVSS
jgi:hypothetical protein